MGQLVFSRYAHRVGCELSGQGFCDGCFHAFENGEMSMRCMKCSGFITPENNQRNVRQVELTTTVQARMGNSGSLTLANTTPYGGYDLCLTCAKDRRLHAHHHFRLAIFRG